MAEKRLKRRSGGDTAAADKLAKGLTAEAARQAILAGPVHDAGGTCQLYYTGSGWQSGMLADDKTLAHARSKVELVAILQDPQRADAFIPRDAALTIEMINHACRHHGFGMVIFVEGDAPA